MTGKKDTVMNEVVETKTTDLTSIAIDNKFIDGLCQQLKQKEDLGLTFPKGYNYTNALTGAYLTLLDTKNSKQELALKVCTKQSIGKAMLDLVTLGLDTQKKQAYFIVYGDKLTLQKSYFGNKAIARRYGAIDFNAQAIYKDDEFRYDIVDGKIVDLVHKQNFMNIDNTKIVGAYCVVSFANGLSDHIEVMNISQLIKAWSKGYGYKSNSGVHEDFKDQMAIKTVTNRAVKSIINTYTEDGLINEIFNETDEQTIDKNKFLISEVKDDIRDGANSVDFEILESDVIDDNKSDIEVDIVVEPNTEGEELPEFMK